MVVMPPSRLDAFRSLALPSCGPDSDPLHSRRKRLPKVGDEVIDVLETNREADEVRGGARGNLLLRLQLRVGRGGRVDDQRLRVADVGEETEDLHVVDQLAAGIHAA